MFQLESLTATMVLNRCSWGHLQVEQRKDVQLTKQQKSESIFQSIAATNSKKANTEFKTHFTGISLTVEYTEPSIFLIDFTVKPKRGASTVAACRFPPTCMDLSIETDPILWDEVIWHLVDLAGFTPA